MRARLLVCLALPLLLPATGRGDDAALRALEARTQKVAREAGPGIVRVDVSRSDAYHKAAYWGVPSKSNEPGQLGRFDADAARKAVPVDAPGRARILRTIAEHDLSHPDTVPESYGSGIVVDRSGLVLTNAHVVRNATRVFVRLPGKRGSWADVHASDPRSDLAVLRLLDPPAGLVALPLGDGGAVRQGQLVLCMANAYTPGFRGDTPTIASGQVNALRQKIPANLELLRDRARVTLHHHGTLIQMSAGVTPGCSGGALLDLDGKVIGLTTALAVVVSNKPGGFAIPFDASTRRIIDVLKAGKEVEYGFLGVVLDDNPGRPVRLVQIAPGSPAALAGLQAGDVVTRINGAVIRDNNDLFLAIGMSLAGSTARIEVTRRGGVRTFTPRLAKYYVPGPVIAARRPPAKFGLRVDYTSILSQRNPFQRWSSRPTPEGVIVREVVPGTSADKARLQPDKIITHVDGRSVRTPADYYDAVARGGDRAELTILNSEGRAERITLEGK